MIELIDAMATIIAKEKKIIEEYKSLFELEDDVEAALNYLDNHPSCSIDEYEEWLIGREKARRIISQ